MKKHGNEEHVFEIGVVIPRRVVQEKDESCDCAYVLVKEFEKVGFVVERVIGIADEFIKVRFSQFLSMFKNSICFIGHFHPILCFTVYNFFSSFFHFGMSRETSVFFFFFLKKEISYDFVPWSISILWFSNHGCLAQLVEQVRKLL